MNLIHQTKSNIEKVEKNVKWFQAAEDGNILTIKTLLEEGFNVNTLNFRGENALHRIGNIPYEKSVEAYKIAKFLIEKNINLEAEDEHQNTPLLSNLIMRKFPEVIHLFIDSGANIHQENFWGYNLITKALPYGKNEIVDRCVALGLNINHRLKNNKTPAENAYTYKEKFKYRILKGLSRYEDQLSQTQKEIYKKEKLRLLFKKTPLD